MTTKKKPAPAPKTKVKKKAKAISRKPAPSKQPKTLNKRSGPKKPNKPTKKQSVKHSPKKSQASTASPANKSAKSAAPAPKSSKPAAQSAGAAKQPKAAARAPESKPEQGGKSARTLLRNRILGKAKPAKPIAFSLDEVREIAKNVADKPEPNEARAKPTKPKLGAHLELKATKPNHIKAASLADVLGFNPKKTNGVHAHLGEEQVAEKYRRYYKLLVDLRNHVTGQLDQHTEETLKRSAKEDSGDLSSYGQHMADAGTDTFDRDFALSLVSNEQEALSEIEAAIQRIKAGTYGICEITQKPIAKERLLAVPFTRHSAEAQKQIERNRHRTRTQAGLFGELGEEGAKLRDDNGDDE